MKIRVDKDNLRIIKLSQLESGEVDVTEVNFIFTPEYEDLIKTAVFTLGDKSYKVILQNDKCFIPTEVLVEGNKITIGVYAFKQDNEELILRYSPVPVTAEILKGSYVEEAENTSHPTPTEIEQLLELITINSNAIDYLSEKVDILEVSKDECKSDIDSIKEDLIDIKSDIDDLEDNVTTINNSITDIEGDIDTLEGNVSDINTSITNINQLDERQNRRLNNLDNFIRQWPKTAYQTGTNINLGKTIEAVVQYEDDKVLYGDTSQDTTNGYQLFNKDDNNMIYNGFLNYGTGTLDNSNNARTLYIPCEANTSYVVSKVVSARFMIGYTSSSTIQNGISVTITQTQATASSLSMTTDSSAKYILVFYYLSTADTLSEETIRNSIMVEKGTTAYPWEKYTGGIASPNPSFPEDISVVTGTQEVAVGGKNLFDNSVERKNAFPNTIVGQQIGYNNSSVTYSYVNCAFLQKGTTYTLSWKQSQTSASTNQRISALIDSNNIILETITTWLNGQTSITFTPNNSGWLVLATDIYATEIQIESGDTATSFEPYITPTTYTIHLGSLELASIGSYQDYIYFDEDEGKWYKKGYIGKVVLNGSESWTSASAINTHYRYYIDFPSGKADTSLICYSNYFKGVSRVNLLNENELATNQFINILSDTFTSLADLKTWLGTHNTQVYYVLATATDIEITDTTLIQDLDEILAMTSIEGTTIIEVSGNLPANIKVRAYAQLQAAT